MIKNLRNNFYKTIYQVFDLFAKYLLPESRKRFVLSGPFRGMAYPAESVGSVLVPKLLGTYEKELSKIISNLPRFNKAVDIGAAEGWYSVGLLFLNKVNKMIAFEKEKQGRSIMRDLAQRNKCLNRLKIMANCDRDIFQRFLQKTKKEKMPTLVICDCEGFEEDLFTNGNLQFLSKVWLLIETHDFLRPGVHAKIKKIMKPSHKVQELKPLRRSPRDFPSIGFLKKISGMLPMLARLAMAERRSSGNAWIFAKPRFP